jgi:hypothetical protein
MNYYVTSEQLEEALRALVGDHCESHLERQESCPTCNALNLLDRLHPSIVKLEKQIQEAVERGYTVGDVNHHVQPIIGHFRSHLMHHPGEPIGDNYLADYVIPRLLAACRAEEAWLNTPDPEPMKRVSRAFANERIWELIYLRSQNKITPERFVELVNIVDMIPAQYGPAESDAYIPGTFDIIREALQDGSITEEEYDLIAAQAPAPENPWMPEPQAPVPDATKMGGQISTYEGKVR